MHRLSRSSECSPLYGLRAFLLGPNIGAWLESLQPHDDNKIIAGTSGITMSIPADKNSPKPENPRWQKPTFRGALWLYFRKDRTCSAYDVGEISGVSLVGEMSVWQYCFGYVPLTTQIFRCFSGSMHRQAGSSTNLVSTECNSRASTGPKAVTSSSLYVHVCKVRQKQ